MSAPQIELLDVTDTAQRSRQHAQIVAMLVTALVTCEALYIGLSDRRWPLLIPAVLALAATVLLARRAARTLQRWDVTYKGHRIRFENSALTGEKLFIDDALAARGGIGRALRLEGVIGAGDGIGDRVIAFADAGLADFRCRLVVEPASPLAKR